MKNKYDIFQDFIELEPITNKEVDEQTKEENAEDLKTKEMINFNQKCIDELKDKLDITSSVVKDREHDIEELKNEQQEIKDYVNNNFSVFSKDENEKQLKIIYLNLYDKKEKDIKFEQTMIDKEVKEIKDLNNQISLLENEIKRIKSESTIELKTETNEDKKEVSVKKAIDLNKKWNRLEESLKNGNLLDEFELEEIKEDKETSNNFTPVEDNIEEFKPETKEENKELIIDFEPSNSDFPDLEIKIDKKDN